MRYPQHILQLVISRDRNITSVQFQVNGHRHAKFWSSAQRRDGRNGREKLTLGSYGEVKREVFWISWVVFQEHESLVQVQVERSEVIQETLATTK